MGSIAAFISAPKTSNILLGLIIFFSATQLGYHFWPASALVYGIRIDYLAPTLYFFDLLIILYLLINRLYDFKALRLSALLPLLLTNLLFSSNPLATLSWSLHLILYLLFILSVPKNYLLLTMYYVLPLSTLFQVTLALAQVALGHSLQGPLYYLGERMVAVGSPSVATASLLEANVLRAYGTFSHPNILAGWLVVSLLIILKLSPTKKLIIGNWLLGISTITTIVGLLLTQSRSAALAFFGLVIPLYLLRSWRTRLFYFVILLTTSYYLLTTGALSRPLNLSLSQRLTLQELSLSVVHSYPIFGTGAQASISTYPLVSPNTRILQPDHNSFTLLFSWFGLFGILSIIPYLKIVNWKLIITSFSPLIPLLFLDHYALTSPQGLFILLLYLRISKH